MDRIRAFYVIVGGKDFHGWVILFTARLISTSLKLLAIFYKSISFTVQICNGLLVCQIKYLDG